jgi:hypothetical protein
MLQLVANIGKSWSAGFRPEQRVSMRNGDDGHPPGPDPHDGLHDGNAQEASPSPGSSLPDSPAAPAPADESGSRQQERRQFPRIKLAATVVLRFASAEAAQESSTVDISEGGVFIRMPNPRPEGTPIQLCLDVGGKMLLIGGVVVRSVRPGEGEPHGIGVLFTELRPEDAVFVRTLVRERLSQ